MQRIAKYFLLLSAIALRAVGVYSQSPASIKEYEKEYVTYPYSDPNPIPVVGKIYPYFRYDGYTTCGEKQLWKIVELENEYLRIRIFPQIGGKIWSVFDKKSNQEMFYDNDVVKFRDISLRGPWTSGGIEFNYGVVGHGPTCSFPVDYRTCTNPDSSVSCIIGVLDLLTRSRWSVEINLPADKSWFTTKSFWHNSNASFQPYYNWVNTGVAAKDDLRFTYPGTHIIRHDGVALPWPLDKEYNKDLSVWRENNFIGSKSYHIVGSLQSYFGAYWSDDDFGMLQYAERDQKIGKKMFSWALSDQGDIWKDLLTDYSGQYVELQSGRLFNQNMAISSLTPFKQIQFTPYATDTWTEYWFPYHGIGKVSSVSLYGAGNIEVDNNGISLKFYPIQDISSTLCFYDSDGKLLYESPVKFTVSQIYSNHFAEQDINGTQRITLNGHEIWSNADDSLDRPVETVPDFDWNTAYGNYLRGRDLIGMRLYSEADGYIRKSLELDGNFVPALTEMAALYFRKMDYDSAYACARKALSIDTYDAKANFEYARAAWKLGSLKDAYDGYEIATLTSPLRSAAYTELAKLRFLSKDFIKARKYAVKSLVNNAANVEALQLIYLCDAVNQKADASVLKQLKEIDPLNPFILFEQYYQNQTDVLKEDFIKSIHSDMAQQTYLELAVYYHGLSLDDRAKAVLSILPSPDGEALYWCAYLCRGSAQAFYYLDLAEQADPSFVFPFREESKDVFEWASTIGKSWKANYYLALLQFSRNNTEKVVALLNKLKNRPNFAPFYSLRGRLSTVNADKEADIKLAIQYAPKEWRYKHQLTRLYFAEKRYKEALKVIEPFYYKHKTHFPTGSLYTKALMYCKDFAKAEKVLSNTYILPFEGERGGRLLYQEIKLRLALQALNDGKADAALKKIEESFLWPRNIGAGKPYENTLDERLEYWLSALAYLQKGDKTAANRALETVAESFQSKSSVYTLLQALALNKLDKAAQADSLFEEWSSLQKVANIKDWGSRFYNDNKNKKYPLDYNNLSRIIGLISGIEDLRLF